MATPIPVPAPHDVGFWREYACRPGLALLLDLDGTLIPFADSVEQAELDRPAVHVLEALAQAGIQVAIVSGRPLEMLERVRPAGSDAWWVAEHGVWRRAAGEWEGPPARAIELDELVHALEPVVAAPGMRIERKTRGVCVHWRMTPPEQRDAAIAAAELVCDEWLEAHPEFERLDGVDMLEVRHASATKASAVGWMRARLPDAVLLAIGDDETDEDMFAALREDEVSIAVRNLRPRQSRARAWLSGPSAVREFLWWIIDARSRASDRPPPLDVPPARPAHARARLVVAANRAPAVVSAGRRQQVSGLVSALQPALAAGDGLWLGWNGQVHDAKPTVAIDADAVPARATFHFPPRWRERFYDGFCNRALWPLFHEFPSRVRYRDADWEAYVEVNDHYARCACELAVPDATIWVHDYHLLLMAQALARHGFRGPKGLFLHVPFPPPDLLDTLPWSDQLLGAMREFDLVGFHTETWADNFRACLQAADARAGGPARQPDIGVFPIAIDPQSFTPRGEELDREVVGLHDVLRGRRMILGVDRLDYAKGIPERLVAFDHLLDRFPEWRGKVTFVQVSVPSRSEVPEYAELRGRVENLVGRINGRYGEADWVPVRYLYRSYDHRVLAQLYRAADVALVTPLRDGMNLVAKEFVAAQEPDRPGVLVLSRFAGAASQLGDAILTNPYHPDGMAIDLDRALRMPLDERTRRHARLAAVVGETTPQSWAADFLGRLAASSRGTAAARS